ncbi:zinc finger protein 691-like [Rana temporaria]|uniref:zinc finger protein 691-like n=1 Tax=Rana temporaria TaxID=8407 RepID=UPI001AAD895A|nr:zinc finger protein 691-like [Rana temporaria]
MKEFSEGHMEVTMEPPERCPRPLYSGNSIQEDHNYAKSDQIQSGNLGDDNIDVKEEYKEKDEQCRMMKEFSERRKDFTIPHHHQMLSSVFLLVSDEGIIKVGSDVEGMYLKDDQQSMEEAGMTRTFKEEDTPTEISTGHAMEKPSKDPPFLWKIQNGDITRDWAGENIMLSTMDGGLHSVDRPWNPSDSEQPRTVRGGSGIQGEEKFPCAEREESFSSELSQHRNHVGEKLYYCSECGKYFQCTSQLVRHQRSHTMERPYSCPECGKCYPRNSTLIRHLKSHTGVKYSCPECGKCYAERSHCYNHYRTHFDRLQYSCSKCGQLFPVKSALARHLKTHTGEKPYSCPVPVVNVFQ